MATASSKSNCKVTYKTEFYRLKNIIKEDNVKVSVYNKAYFKDNEASGYADIWQRKISIAGKTSYKFLIMRLMHEYGHLVDYAQWKKSKRWKLNTEYLSTGPYVQIVPKDVKRAILYSEFLADERAKRLLKTFKSSYPIELINEHQFINVNLRNFELTYGKMTPSCIVDIFLANMTKETLTKENFMDLHL